MHAAMTVEVWSYPSKKRRSRFDVRTASRESSFIAKALFGFAISSSLST